MKPYPKELIDVAVDVVIRFKGLGMYGSWTKAVRTMKRRAPGRNPVDYELLFVKLGDVFDRSVELVCGESESVFRGREKNRTYREFSDVDFEYCMGLLRLSGAEISDDALGLILGWVIRRYYLI